MIFTRQYYESMIDRGADHWAWQCDLHCQLGLAPEQVDALGEWIANAMQAAVDRHVRNASRDCAIAEPSSEAST
jgi:hypothetical protein